MRKYYIVADGKYGKIFMGDMNKTDKWWVNNKNYAKQFDEVSANNVVMRLKFNNPRVEVVIDE